MQRCTVFLIWLMAMALLAGCGGGSVTRGPQVPPSPNLQATKVAMATEVIAKITADAAATARMLPTSTTPPTAIPAKQATDIPTITVAKEPTKPPTPTLTDAPTVTPRPTAAPRPTVTPTRAPGLGDVMECPGYWRISPITAPDPSATASDPAKGTYVKIYLYLTNLQEKTADLSSSNLELVGELEGKQLLFAPTFYSPSLLDKSQKITSWMDDFPPLVKVKTTILFDVNEAASNWKLRLKIPSGRCEREIALYDTRSAQLVTEAATGDGAITATLSGNANLRSGPSTAYPVVGQGTQGQTLTVTGRNADGTWFEVCCYAGTPAWIASSLAKLSKDVSEIAISQKIPTPPPTPKPAPTPKPLSKDTGIGAPEVRAGNWGLKLYNMKKAKTVYFFGTGTVASGVWAVPLVEIRNLGTGTAQPNDTLDFYLQDAAGRKYAFDEFSKGALGASWQFQAGHLYDDINPGIVLGTALPFDVPPDLGDVWLRVNQNPDVGIYLGNVSQLPAVN